MKLIVKAWVEWFITNIISVFCMFAYFKFDLRGYDPFKAYGILLNGSIFLSVVIVIVNSIINLMINRMPSPAFVCVIRGIRNFIRKLRFPRRGWTLEPNEA